MSTENSTDKMRNIGPKSAAWLRQVGLRTREDLAAAGTVEAFMRVKRAGFKPTLNLLYAIEGALQDCHWQEVPDARRSELRNSRQALLIKAQQYQATVALVHALGGGWGEAPSRQS